MLVRGATGSIAFILLAGSAALAADPSPADAPAPSQETQAPVSPVVSAAGAYVSGPAPFLILPALPSDYFATTPHLLGEWPGIRSKLNDLGITVSLTGVDEAVMNLSGGERRIAQEAGQVALQAEFDLQKSLGLQGTSVLVTLVDRWGRDAATDAGIPALQLLNEVYGRGNILRLEQFAWDQKWFGDRIETTAGRLAFGDEFFTYPCDFINLTFCPGQAGNLVGDYIYNWPVSQWAAVAKVNFGSEGYFKAGVFDSNTAYLDTTPNPASLPAFPGESQGALLGIQKAFDVGHIALEIVTSWVTLGALFGSLGGGYAADLFGRKRALLAAAALFIIGALVQAFAPNVPVLVVGRLVAGFGVGVAAVAAPLYAAELAPAAQRGRFVSSYQLAITVGIFVAYFVNQALAGPEGWRAMLGVAAVPGVLLALAVLTAVESPRWFAKVGRRDDALRTLVALGAEKDAEARLAAIAASLREEVQTPSWTDVFAPRWRTPLRIGLGLAVLQQVTGINAIIYYSNSIFAAAGYATPAAQAQATTWGIGAVNVLSTFIAIAFIDHLGRRPLLIAGLVGMGLSLAAVGFSFWQSGTQGSLGASAGVITLVALVVFIISFAFSLGPVTWTVINEIYPGEVRGRAVAVATAVNWGAAFLVSGFFLSLVKAIGQAYTFWLFAAFCVIGLIWVIVDVPETRGRSLEEIEAAWRQAPGRS